jgi:helix-turn-helix protein
MIQALKPQDVLVLVKLCSYDSGSRPPYSVLASDIRMSRSEINASVKRLQSAGLVLPKELHEMPIKAAVEEFLIHGVKYMFPARLGSWVRGMPTSYAAEPLRSMIVPGGDPIPVWPDAKGKERGLGLTPLYRSVPEAARKDPLLYHRLSLIDAIRSGNARERKIAEKELVKSLRKVNGKNQH